MPAKKPKKAPSQTRAKAAGIKAPARAPRRRAHARRLPAVQQAQRDALMVARRAQGWTWPMIAEESGITESAAKKAVERRLAAQPFRLDADPVAIVQSIFEGYQLSIGDFEALASHALERNNLPVAVGAKKGANDAREKLMNLLSATGRLPRDLQALRHIIDLRATAIRMLDAVDGLERELDLVMRLDDADEREREARRAALRVRSTFNELLGVEDAPENVVDGHAELTA